MLLKLVRVFFWLCECVVTTISAPKDDDATFRDETIKAAVVAVAAAHFGRKHNSHNFVSMSFGRERVWMRAGLGGVRNYRNWKAGQGKSIGGKLHTGGQDVKAIGGALLLLLWETGCSFGGKAWLEHEKIDDRTIFTDAFAISYLSQPVGIWERQVGECPFPLHEIPRGTDIIIPRNDPFHRVPDQIDVDGVRQVEPKQRKKRSFNVIHFRSSERDASFQMSWKASGISN